MLIEIDRLEARDHAEAFALVTEVFAQSSTLHRALEISVEDYRSYLALPFEAMADEGLSLVARDRNNGTLLGCLIATELDSSSHAAVTERFAPLQAITRALLTQRPATDARTLLVDMAAVAPTARNKKVYRDLRQAIEPVARARGFKRIVGELSSVATQRVVLEQMGHQKVAEIRFSDFEFHGLRPFHSITAPPSLILSERRL